MTDEDLKYLMEERIAIMTQSGVMELEALQQARREIRELVKNDMSLIEAQALTTRLEKME